MKTKLTALFGLTAIAITSYATIIGPPYDNSKPPKMLLPIAYEHAMSALGSDTNQYHCMSAKVTTDFGPDGEWQFIFYSTNSKPKWVSVEFNGKIHIEDIMNR